ncbi:MAG TPA: EAL domain-containing protein [Telmatospirillum sp.]|nr:EAL domain-containing protein [Telmatospirillum sp.]
MGLGPVIKETAGASSGPAKVALTYASLAATWILLSDSAIGMIFDNPKLVIAAGTIKGWAFVALTTAILYGMMKRMVANIAAMHADVVREQAAKLQTAKLLSTLSDRSTDAIYVKDKAGRYLLFNREAGRVVGTDCADVIGQDDRAIFPPGEAETLMDADHLLMEQGVTHTFEEVLTTSLGVRTFLTTKGPLYDDDHRLTGLFGIARDITERKSAWARVEFLAYHDALTELPNRMLAEDRAKVAMAHAGRSNAKMALLFVDLDNFKSINDSLGHHRADDLLKQVAGRFGRCLRETDTLSRYGGDEFLVLAADVEGSDDANSVAEKLLHCLSDPFEIHGQSISISASIGIALFPEDGRDFTTLVKKADTAMYRAKEVGRNTFRFFDLGMHSGTADQLLLRQGLRRALDQEEFVLHYQPQIDLRSGRVIGAEALVRWNHPEHGLIPPGRFISIAEDSGLIVPLGEWVLREACRQMAVWRCGGLSAMGVAVNLSGLQFKRGNLEQTVEAALKESDLDPACLELELTESILIKDVDMMLTLLARLRSLGLKFSIDDFGTGYSSFAYLKRFKVDKLKIDQSFVRDLAEGAEDASIVQAIIQMAKSLKVTVIAEGVETERALACLQDMACDEAQGFHFARPMPADAFAAYVAERHQNCDVPKAEAGLLGNWVIVEDHR